MPVVTYISHDGAINDVEVASGTSVMQGAVDNMIDGIVAECGGSCSCATCHCYIDDAWMDKMPAASEMEKICWNVSWSRKHNSRSQLPDFGHR